MKTHLFLDGCESGLGAQHSLVVIKQQKTATMSFKGITRGALIPNVIFSLCGTCLLNSMVNNSILQLLQPYVLKVSKVVVLCCADFLYFVWLV